MKMKRALISTYHKEGIELVARELLDNDWEILSTGGTAKYLKQHGFNVLEISSLTNFPEILDGRVKTLHPLIFGPILAKNTPEHLEQLKQFAASKIELVIVNFYPFEEALQEKEKGIAFMVENIDVGGPAMVRAAAKNFKDTIVVIDKTDYLPVVEKLIHDGNLNLDERQHLAAKAFSYTSFYDSLIAEYFAGEAGGMGSLEYINMSGKKNMTLRYGENPHQKAALYIRDKNSPLYNMQKLHGKELSFNNILDLSMVYEMLNYFVPGVSSGGYGAEMDDFAVVVKHQNPCGAALGMSQLEAFKKALEGDPQSAYGGIVGFNKPVTKETAENMKKIFLEVIIAPDFTSEALEILMKKINLRLIKIPLSYIEKYDIKMVPGGFVFQDRDNGLKEYEEFSLKTSRPLTDDEIKDVRLGWKLIKFVKSNGIIIVKNGTLLGVGAGQMSRVDSV
ncbi:MAG: bifunctional phosphoribosylaminoimidazolecarboxamide formyltransferase/IMP cyclohydrolase, partial [Acidobacteria bacterium]|nr:bifunctional phosphoribosylaminoimidazolecarboxamide formyltransferase/IMP cyclohydrolase [Acidobacteriota bacterium]